MDQKDLFFYLNSLMFHIFMPFQKVLTKFLPFLLYLQASFSFTLHYLFFISLSFITLASQRIIPFNAPTIKPHQLFNQQIDLRAYLKLKN